MKIGDLVATKSGMHACIIGTTLPSLKIIGIIIGDGAALNNPPSVRMLTDDGVIECDANQLEVINENR